MNVTVRTPIAHQCPYKPENDLGSLVMVFNGEAPELHDLRVFLETFHNAKMSHEHMTRAIHVAYPTADVTTYWNTAGMDIEVAVPRDEPR